MTHRTRVLLAAFIAQLLFAAGGAAQVATTATDAMPFVGSWRYAPQPDDVIEQAIERGIEEMNFVTRPIARRRLRATNNRYSTIEVRVGSGEFTTVLEGRAITSPADGRAIQWRREDGELLQVSTHVRNGTLVQAFGAEDGARENVYSVSADGRRLILHVTIRSERLPTPVTYRLLYDRVD